MESNDGNGIQEYDLSWGDNRTLSPLHTRKYTHSEVHLAMKEKSVKKFNIKEVQTGIHARGNAVQTIESEREGGQGLSRADTKRQHCSKEDFTGFPQTQLSAVLP